MTYDSYLNAEKQLSKYFFKLQSLLGSLSNYKLATTTSTPNPATSVVLTFT